MNSINIQARLDICTLATLAKAYIADGALIRSKSDLVWKAVEHITSLYETKGAVRFTDVYEATEFLQRIGLPLGTSQRTVRQVQSAQVNQNAMGDFGVPDFGRQTTKGRLVQQEQSDRERYEEAAQAIKSRGLVPISFEEFMKNKTKRVQEEEDVVVSTADVAEREWREKERLAEEKAAASPEALRAAFMRPATVENDANCGK